ncbi:MAG: hypothetical protein IPI90_10380 [Saprospiraceae bacterium]|nr:hypothetical protein [Candidatus Vicinibacter affinis]
MNSSWNTEFKKKVNPTEPERASGSVSFLPDQNEALIKEHLMNSNFFASIAGNHHQAIRSEVEWSGLARLLVKEKLRRF